MTGKNIPKEPELRDLAYGLWADACHRSAARVAARMQEMGHAISAELVRQWARRYDWEKQVDDELMVHAPGIRRMTAFRLIGNADLASRIEQQYLREYVETGKAPDKTVVLAVKEALAHGGFSPVGARDPVGPSTPQQMLSSSALMDRYFPNGLPAGEDAADAAPPPVEIPTSTPGPIRRPPDE